MDGFKDDMLGHRFFILIQNPWSLLCVTEAGYIASVPTTTELGEFIVLCPEAESHS
jgi:hypothetical protein